MECLNNQNLDTCINYCNLLVQTTKYEDIDNLWDCVDRDAQIPPIIYGERKCNSLTRYGKVRPSKKECYEKISINPENDFKGIYDAKLAYCKFIMKNEPYETWATCNAEWGVQYDEEDCQYMFTNEQQSIDMLFSCIKWKAELKLSKERCNYLPLSILQNFNRNITWPNTYLTRDLDVVINGTNGTNATANATGNATANATSMNGTVPKVENKTMGPEVYYNSNVTMTEMEILDSRFRCYVDMLLIQKDREYCQNSTITGPEYFACISRNKITIIPDDVLFRYGRGSYAGIGYGPAQTAEMDATGIGKDASRYIYELTGL